MKQVTVTCLERGKAKTYTGELMSYGVGNLIFATHNHKGSNLIKQIRQEKIISMRVEDTDKEVRRYEKI